MPPSGKKRHGKYGSPEHRAWSSMIRRCTNPTQRAYKNYGGRGIVVCERWLKSFECFLEDMGRLPPDHTLDRIDNDGNYEPGNCRWATKTTQANNTRRNHFIEHAGRRQTIAEWAMEIGVKHATLKRRIYKGLSLDRALLPGDLRK